MKLNSHGQVIIPKKLRELLGLQPGSELQVSLTKEGILIAPKSIDHRKQLLNWLQETHGDEMATLTTDQVLKLLR